MPREEWLGTERPGLTATKLALLKARLSGAHQQWRITVRPAHEAPALSFAQERLWFLEQLGGVGAAYHVPWGLRLRGELDVPALRAALDSLIRRHEALRTTFGAVEGVPYQVIAPAEASRFALVEEDLSRVANAAAALEALAATEAQTLFDLARGPLIRGRLLRLGAEEHALLVTMHHIVTDGWSMGVFERELSALYGAFRRGEADLLPRLPVQYADYAVWQRAWVTGEVLREQSEYWRETLAGVPEVLTLPADHPRPAVPDYAGAVVPVELDAGLTAGLKALSQRHGVTLFHVLLAGWAVVLSRLAGQREVVIGAPAANRERTELEGLIGFFVNTLALRIDLAGRPTVAELLERVKGQALGAQAHEALPFERVVELVNPVRSLAHSPVFQVMFAWQNAPAERLVFPELIIGPLEHGPAAVTAKFDLTLGLQEVGERIVGALEYATALWKRETVERYVGYLQRVLAALTTDVTQPVEQLPLLSAAERAQVVEGWNATAAEYPSERCVHELFEAQAARTPDAVAVVLPDGQTLTYQELDEEASRLAHYLEARGVALDQPVGLFLERSREMVVALLGTLKAGAAYVPLDAAHPPARLAAILAESRPAVVLTQQHLRDRLPPFAGRVLSVDAEWSAIRRMPAGSRRSRAHPESLVYVLYTSGSTGVPKGIALSHRALVNLICWHAAALRPAPAMLQFASLGFDVSFYELFGAWCSGGCVYLIGEELWRDVDALLRYVSGQPIDRVILPVVVLERWAAAEAAPELVAGVREIITAGEQLQITPAIRRLFRALPSAVLHNHYGPTEAHVVTAFTFAGAPEAWPTYAPIGRPQANSRTYVLDGAGAPVPVGVVGELYLGGVQLARGYLDRPGLTGERFVPDPFGPPGGRLYRTGDRARWLPSGELEYLGRIDFQVKVRGYRVELGEIEAVLAGHPGVRQAVVLARADVPGDVRLVAYVVGEAAEAEAEVLGAEGLRAYLSARLPAYMVPAAYVRVAALPLTPSGKVDRRALPAPASDAYAYAGYEAPVGDVEEAVAAIWAELLGVERIGRSDDFFALGGHSLLAVQVLARVRQGLGREAALTALFRTPTLAGFAASLAGAPTAMLPPIMALGRDASGVPVAAPALSFAQERLWFLEQLGGLGAAYHVPWGLRLRGALDVPALRAALDSLVCRHEALRTTFGVVDGVPHQVIAPAAGSRFALVEEELSPMSGAATTLETLAVTEAQTLFDLARGPLIRGRLLRLGAEEHALLVTMHHIVSDGWSMGVLLRELSALYNASQRGTAEALPPLPVQYADYAVWQRAWVTGEVLREQSEYWRETLAGVPEVLTLPADHPRPAVPDYAGAVVPVELDAGLTAGLKALSQRHGVTLFHVLLAGWAVVLSRLAGQREVVIGTPAANRGRTELEGLIGFFVNTLALRIDLAGRPTVAELLERVKGQALGAQAHEALPFERVVELVNPVRSLAHSPVFQVMFAWQNAPGARLALPGLTLAPMGAAALDAPEETRTKFDLELELQEVGERIEGSLEYATALWERGTIARHGGYLQAVLAGLVAGAAHPVDAIDILSAAERAQVVAGWNATATAWPVAEEPRVMALIAVQAAQTPAAVAVRGDDGVAWSYATLLARAARVAAALRAGGVGPETVVGVLGPREPEWLAALLGIWLAGGAYLPLDVRQPAGRIATLVRQAGSRHMLVAPSAAEVLAEVEAQVGTALWRASWTGEAEADDGWSALGGMPAGAGRQLAYVLFTSGSTGQPKGALLEQAGLVNHLWAKVATLGLTAADVVAQTAAVSFDISIWQLVVPLLVGGRVEMVGEGVVYEPAQLAAAVEARGVTVLEVVPSQLAPLLPYLPLGGERTGGRQLRWLVATGEALPVALARQWLAGQPGCGLINAYGPTECSDDVTQHEVTVAALGAEAGGVPIGRPLGNTQLYVLDGRGEPVPVGVVGELYVGGQGVGRGYAGAPGQTAARFVPDAFGQAGSRLYRTGDRVRWLTSGELEYLGRTDDQVKVRGQRIELGEIEAVLASHPGVEQAVVLARQDVPGDVRLVAYVVGAQDVVLEALTLRAYLSARLPWPMLPAAYVPLATLPLMPSGKVDRRALPAPESGAYASEAYEAPVGEVEEELAAIWAALLKVERVGRQDDFFALGGHSLLAVTLVERMRRQGLRTDVRTLFTTPTLAALAAAAASAPAMIDAPPNLVPAPQAPGGDPSSFLELEF